MRLLEVSGRLNFIWRGVLQDGHIRIQLTPSALVVRTSFDDLSARVECIDRVENRKDSLTVTVCDLWAGPICNVVRNENLFTTIVLVVEVTFLRSRFR